MYAISQAIESFLMIEGIPPEQIRVFDNTLQQVEDMIPLVLPKHKKEIKLIYAGRLVYSKGVQYLLRAIPLLMERGFSIHCAVLGDGWYRDELIRLADRLGIADQVNFAGKISGKDIDRWYAESDIAVVPSIWPEPASLVVPEARKTGKPVVVFNSGGLPEWADFMDGIYIAERGDHRHLAETILSVASGREHTVRPKPGTTGNRKRVNIIEDLGSMVISGA